MTEQFPIASTGAQQPSSPSPAWGGQGGGLVTEKIVLAYSGGLRHFSPPPLAGEGRVGAS